MTHKALYILFAVCLIMAPFIFVQLTPPRYRLTFFGKIWSVRLALIVAKLYIVGIALRTIDYGCVVAKKNQNKNSSNGKLKTPSSLPKSRPIQSNCWKLKSATLKTALDKALKEKAKVAKSIKSARINLYCPGCRGALWQASAAWPIKSLATICQPR
ncbi:MAG: hypothetical protein IPJ49_30970 [Candidatus Obscuribacter sp.]|nr:hypothetical protein [Candidatus Obscuribacter sp.]